MAVVAALECVAVLLLDEPSAAAPADVVLALHECVVDLVAGALVPVAGVGALLVAFSTLPEEVPVPAEREAAGHEEVPDPVVPVHGGAVLADAVHFVL